MTIVRMPDGTQVDFKDLPPDQIRSLIQQKFPDAAKSVAPKGPSLTDAVAPKTLSDAAGKSQQTEVPFLNGALQAAARGMADLAGAPVDLPVGLFNLTQIGLDQTLGRVLDTPPTPLIPFSLSDTIADAASSAAESVGLPMYDPEAIRLYDPIRFGAGAGAGGGALAAGARGLKTAAETGKRLPSIADTFVRPYVSNPGRTIAGDVGSGVGAGAGLDFAEENYPDSPETALLAMLAGGIGGSSATEIGHFAGRTAKDFAPGSSKLPIDPQTTRPVGRSEKEQAARITQAFAADPLTGAPGAKTASDTIGEAADTFRDQGLPVPSSGTISGNRGLMELEGRQRTQNNRVFRDKDEEIKAAGSERINQIRDPNADQTLIKDAVPERRKELAQMRDDDALPHLQRAEASGVTVDPQPVVDVIESTLATAKRPPVRAALTEARKMLNAVGSDELDTSISGLYETRKAINDIIEGRSENATGKYAQKELIKVRTALDDAITTADPEFGEYLTKYRAGSEPLDVFKDSATTQQLIERDPRSVAKAILEDDYGASARFDEVASLIGNKPETKRAWKSAVADAVADKITGATKLDDSENFAVEVAKSSRFFKKHQADLAKVFTDPGEMNVLQQGQALLDTLKNAGVKSATGGSNTADKFSGFMKTAEVALKARYGVLKGGGILRTLRIAAASLPNNQAAVERLLLRAALDPDLMRDLLNAKVRNLDYYASNPWVRRAIAGSEFTKESANQEKEPDAQDQ